MATGSNVSRTGSESDFVAAAGDIPTAGDERHEVYVRPSTVAMVLSIVAAFVVAAWLVVQLSTVIGIVAGGAFLAIAADPAVQAMQRRGVPRGMAVLVLVLVLILLLVIIGWIFIPPLVAQADSLIETAPELLEQLRQHPVVQRADEQFGVVDRAITYLERLPEVAAANLATVAGSIASGLIEAVTILAVGALLLAGGEGIVRNALLAMPSLARGPRWEVVKGAYHNVSRYIAGTLTVATIDALTVLAALWLLDVPNFLPLALWVGLWSVIPNLGAFVGSTPAVLVAFIDEPWKGIVMLGFIIAYQEFETYFISPTVLGRAVHLSPAIIFIAVLAGIDLFGIIGAVIGVPTAATLQIVFRQALRKREEEAPQQVRLARERIERALANGEDGDRDGDGAEDGGKAGGDATSDARTDRDEGGAGEPPPATP